MDSNKNLIEFLVLPKIEVVLLVFYIEGLHSVQIQQLDKNYANNLFQKKERRQQRKSRANYLSSRAKVVNTSKETYSKVF